MKWCLTLGLLFSGLALASEATIDHVFVPRGFDSNDTVEVVVTGFLENSCHSRQGVEVHRIGQQIDLKVLSTHRTPEAPEQCLSLKIPFMEVVSLGQLPAGTYQIQSETLVVTDPLSEAVDNHVYAKVERIDLGFTGGLGGQALLIASAPSSCIELDHVEYVSNERDTMTILPIMKQVSEVCDQTSSRIVIPVQYDLQALPHSVVLLSVRSIDGRSVNMPISKE